MERLRVPNIGTYLNITNYSEENDNYFQLRLDNMVTGQELIFEADLEYHKKNGWILNRRETQDLICN